MPEFATNGLIILCAAGGLYFFWQLSRKVVKWGFLILYFLIGAGVTWILNPSQSAVLPVVAGLVFAWTVMTIKAKIWKAVVGAAVVTGAAIVLPAFLDTPKPETDKAKAASKSKLRSSVKSPSKFPSKAKAKDDR